MIVIEGMDNSGKSTLGIALAGYLQIPLQESEGPPRSEDEINDRVDRYQDMTKTVFVRHPVTSNAIYGSLRPEGDPITIGRQMLFYESKPIIIYCDAGTRGLDAHVVKDHDTPKHLDNISRNYDELLLRYRVWAAQKAHLVYRIGDDMDLLIRMVNYMDAWLRPDSAPTH